VELVEKESKVVDNTAQIAASFSLLLLLLLLLTLLRTIPSLFDDVGETR